MMIFYRNTDPDFQPSVVCKELFVLSTSREDGGRLVRVNYENSDRVDACPDYVFGNSMVLSTPEEDYVATMPREYFAHWYRRCDLDGNLLDL